MGESTFAPSKGQTIVSVDCKKGLNVLEQYLLGRYSMYTHVYFHKLVRGFEVTVMNIIRRVLEKDYTDLVGFKYFSDLRDGSISVEDYLKVEDFSVWTWFKEWYEKTQDTVLKELLYHLLSRKPYYKVIEPPKGHVEYSEKREKILTDFAKEDRQYSFLEDSPTSIAYKDLYISDVLDEIYVTLDGETIPLSAIDHSIVANAQNALKKQHLVWCVKRERG